MQGDSRVPHEHEAEILDDRSCRLNVKGWMYWHNSAHIVTRGKGSVKFNANRLLHSDIVLTTTPFIEVFFNKSSQVFTGFPLARQAI